MRPSLRIVIATRKLVPGEETSDRLHPIQQQRCPQCVIASIVPIVPTLFAHENGKGDYFAFPYGSFLVRILCLLIYNKTNVKCKNKIQRCGLI